MNVAVCTGNISTITHSHNCNSDNDPIVCKNRYAAKRSRNQLHQGCMCAGTGQANMSSLDVKLVLKKKIKNPFSSKRGKRRRKEETQIKMRHDSRSGIRSREEKRVQLYHHTIGGPGFTGVKGGTMQGRRDCCCSLHNGWMSPVYTRAYCVNEVGACAITRCKQNLRRNQTNVKVLCGLFMFAM